MDGNKTSWHSIALDAAFEHLRSRPTGLTAAEAELRLTEYGPNRLTPPAKRSLVARFVSQFNNVLIYVLIITALITAFLGHWIDSGVIIGVVVINALIGFIQEGKAEKALDAIKNILSHQALVQREGKKSTIPAERLVPGDVVFLQSGDKVPADLRLFKVKNLRIDEAPLTGESMPVEKSSEPVSEAATIGDRLCLAYSGTLVTYGQGAGVVVATGDATEIGLISEMLAKVRPLTTKLLKQMSEFAHQLTMVILAVAAVTFIFGVFVRKYSISDMFMSGVGLAVAAIPEGLPAIITITLAIGVQRMAKRSALIRRLPAVETLGSVTVICSDKTGTLTRNEMTVKSAVTAANLFDVTGAGYNPHGGFRLGEKEISPADYHLLTEVSRASLLCNDSVLKEKDGLWAVDGDPMEGALVAFAIKAGLDRDVEDEKFPRTDFIPFESEHRFMATLHHDHAGHGFIYVKGAPEKIITMCNKQILMGEEQTINIPYWHERIGEMAGRGERVLALAFKPAAQEERALNFAAVEGGLSLIGLLGIIDPPREEAIKAVADCKSAGIRVKMITGDHALTALAIGSRMGIGDGALVMTGEELQNISDAELVSSAGKIDVFARVSPEHKLRLVQALQSAGHVVAMTGDGVNDAPALKRADVGVAMGLKGTEVAKEASEMVLADDNFASIAYAVEEGRTVYDNIRKAITFILPTNGGEAGIIIAAILSGRMLPITPVQILWVNMITAVTLALSLSFEPPEEGVMKRPPRDPRDSILSMFLIWRIVFVSLILVIGTFGLFLWERMHGISIEGGRTVAVNALVMFEVFYLMNTRRLKESVLNFSGFRGNRFIYIAIFSVLIAQLFYTYAPPMQRLFGSEAIGLSDWIRIIITASSVFILVELEKIVTIKNASKKKKGVIPDK